MDETPKPRKRKNYPEYTKKQAQQRREKARLEGLCDSLCGRPVTEGINHRTGKPYRSCETCRKRQSAALRRKSQALKAAKAQLSTDACTECLDHGGDDDNVRREPIRLVSCPTCGSLIAIDLRDFSDTH